MSWILGPVSLKYPDPLGWQGLGIQALTALGRAYKSCHLFKGMCVYLFIYIYIHIYTYMYIYTYIAISVCVCVCVCLLA